METAQPALQWLADRAGPYLPRLVGALGIAFGAWLAARLLRAAVLRMGTRAQLDERLHSPGMAALLADIAHGAVWLLALPALLGALEIKGLLDPVNVMLSRLLGFVPNLVGAAVVLGVGLLVARVVQRVVVGLLTAAGSERLAERLGLGAALGERSLAGIAGTLLFALILLPTLVSVLQVLALDAVTRPVTHLLDSVVALIPKLLSAAITLALAALIGRALASAAAGLLAGLGLNRLPGKIGLPGDFAAGGREPAELAGTLVMAAVMLAALIQASEVLGFAALTAALAALGAALARLAAALVVLIVGLWLAHVAAQAVAADGAPRGRLLARGVRGVVLFFAGALALRQAGLPAEIVALAFGAVVGALALALAVALGVGGRHVAARWVERAAAAWDAAAPAAPATPGSSASAPTPPERDAATPNL